MLDEDHVAILKDLVSKGEINKCLKMIIDIANKDMHSASKLIENAALRNLSWFSLITKEKSMGIIKREDYNVERNQITNNAIQLVDIVDGAKTELEDFSMLGEENIRKRRILELGIMNRIIEAGLLVVFLCCIYLLLSGVISFKSNSIESILRIFTATFVGSLVFIGFLKWRDFEQKKQF